MLGEKTIVLKIDTARYNWSVHVMQVYWRVYVQVYVRRCIRQICKIGNVPMAVCNKEGRCGTSKYSSVALKF